jgi:hypothetical protein
MRHLMLALLIALLPLRGWMGDAMALGTQHATVVQVTSAMHADCAGHHAGSVEATSSHSTNHTCHACDVCHSPAFAPMNGLTWTSPRGPVPQPERSERFASAVPQPGIKPPIS